MQDCLSHYTQVENIEYRCGECRNSKSAKKELKFLKLPKVLVILLKRFESDLKKIRSNIGFPITGLDMSPYLCENVHTNSASNVKEYMYDLIGVSTHVGSLSSGHYTAYASLGEGNWVFFNDENASSLRAQQWKENLGIDTSSVYMLVYRQSILRGRDGVTDSPSNFKKGQGVDDALHDLQPQDISPFMSTGL